MERRSRVDNTRRRLLSDNRRVPTSIEASEGKEQVTLQRTSSKRRIVDKASGSAERAAPAMIYNWAGFYIGGHIGGDWRNNTVLDNNNSQFIAGVQGGADYQFTRSWVIGVEANYSFKPSTGNNGGFAFATTGGAGLVTNNSADRGLGSVTGRLGWTWGPGLLYVRGGYGFRDNSNNIAVAVAGAPVPFT